MASRRMLTGCEANTGDDPSKGDFHATKESNFQGCGRESNHRIMFRILTS